MTTPPEENPTSLESLASQQMDLLKALNLVADFVVEQRAFNERISSAMESSASATTAGFNAMAGKVDGLTAKMDGLTDDIAMVKGGHAIAAMHRNAALIADDLSCQLIEVLPQVVVVGFAKVAADDGEPPGEVDSFRHADMVMYGRGANGHPCYIAVEASFTVNANDVRRAARNAGYLQKYTGIQSHAVVAGVDVLPDAQALIHQGDAQLYRIRPGDLQPE